MTTLCVFNTNELTANWFSHLPLCSLPIQLYLVDSFFYAASATSAAAVSYSSIFFFSLVVNLQIQLFRSLFGFVFPLFGQPMFDKLGLGGGNSVRFLSHLTASWGLHWKDLKNSYWPVSPSLLESRFLSGFITKEKNYVLEIHWRECQLYLKEYHEGLQLYHSDLDIIHLLGTHL